MLLQEDTKEDLLKLKKMNQNLARSENTIIEHKLKSSGVKKRLHNHFFKNHLYVKFFVHLGLKNSS